MQIFKIHAPLNHDPIPGLQSIEVSSTLQIPSFHVVGLPAREVSEARERIRAAIQSCGFEFPKRRVVLNLSPASVRKQGTGLDLAMALAVLSSSVKNKKSQNSTDQVVAWGELGLDGSIKPAGQIFRALYATWSAGIAFLIFPQEEVNQALDAAEVISRAKLFQSPKPQLVPVRDLDEAWSFLALGIRNKAEEISILQKPETESIPATLSSLLLPLPPALERVIGVAASGCHHLLLLGPRGTGKSHALEWLVALQPESSPENRVTQILLQELHSGKITHQALPVRRIGSQVRPAALIGSSSGLAIKPGEFSLAHGGLLVADELPEWARDSRESLREPMEQGNVTLTRTRGTFQLPARFALAANGNLCPCGGWPRNVPAPSSTSKSQPRVALCNCSQKAQHQYLARLSGPVLDRIDLVVKIHGYTPQTAAKCKPISALKEQVLKARERCLASWHKAPGLLTSVEIEKLLGTHTEWQNHPAVLNADSLRSRHKIIRVALTLASWDEMSHPTSAHFVEASCYRPERLTEGH